MQVPFILGILGTLGILGILGIFIWWGGLNFFIDKEERPVYLKSGIPNNK